MSTVYHESGLSVEAKSIHRAIASMCEELEAVDWYNQRADVAEDAELKEILIHNRNEEIEHASMLLEWLRGKMPKFDTELKTYLFSSAQITEVEEAGAEGGDEEASEPSSDLGIGRL